LTLANFPLLVQGFLRLDSFRNVFLSLTYLFPDPELRPTKPSFHIALAPQSEFLSVPDLMRNLRILSDHLGPPRVVPLISFPCCVLYDSSPPSFGAEWIDDRWRPRPFPLLRPLVSLSIAFLLFFLLSLARICEFLGGNNQLPTFCPFFPITHHFPASHLSSFVFCTTVPPRCASKVCIFWNAHNRSVPFRDLSRSVFFVEVLHRPLVISLTVQFCSE